MKFIYILTLLVGLGGNALAQGISSVAGTVILKGGSLRVKGDLRLSGGAFVNDGHVFVSGNIVNNQAMTEADKGSLTLDGTASQTISGTEPYFTRFLTVNNAGGVVLGNSIKVGGKITFLNGIVDASNNSATLVLGDTALVTGVSDASHVNGSVIKTGIGNFLYPVGDGVRYQPVALDLTENSAGMSVRYFAEDVGAGSFATTGASNIALEAYNKEEYWDLVPKGTATGKVVIRYDNYNNPSITTSDSLNVFKVAHLRNGDWLNEGDKVTGDLMSGHVTSKVISSWSPFTLGVIPEVRLPVTLVSFHAKAIESSALIEWETVSETNASHFEVERSSDAKNFEKIGTVAAVGNSTAWQTYLFTDLTLGNQSRTVYYRLRSVDRDGTFSFSRSVSVQTKGSGQLVNVYPNPARKVSVVTVMSRVSANEVSLWDMFGRQVPVRTELTSDTSVKVNLHGVASGVYFLKLTTNEGVVNHKLVVE